MIDFHKKDIKNYTKDVYVLSIFFFIIYLMLNLFINTGNLDEGIYLTVSDDIYEGKILYKDVYESHPPMLFFINSLFIKLVGRDIFLIRLFIVIISSMSAFLIYKITNQITKNNNISIGSGIVFSIFSSLPTFEGFWVMTEPYLVLFELMTIFFLLNAILKKANILYLICGIFMASSILTRQTSGIFLLFIFIFILIKKMTKDIDVKNIIFILFGFALPFILFGYYFMINNAIYDAIYWIIYEPLKNVSTLGKTEPKFKSEWFMDIIITSIPLLVAIFYFLLRYRKINYIKINYILPILILWMMTLYLINFMTNLVPGFHHEYRETLVTISVIAPMGLSKILEDLKINNKAAMLFFLIFVIGALMSFEKSYDMFYNFKNYESQDTPFAYNISKSLKECGNNNIYVFETKWPKISLETYFLAGKRPEIKRYFYFPPYINRNESNEFMQNSRNTDCIAIIGDRPPFKEARNMYDFILTNYIQTKYLGNYTPYEWLPDQPVVIYKKIDSFNSSNFINILDLNVRNINLSYPDKTDVVSGKYDDNIVLSYRFSDSDKWFSLLFKNDEPLDLGHKKVLLKINIYSTNENDTMQIDLVDKKGNWRRFETGLLHTNTSDYFISLDENNFGLGIDYENIERIHISIANYIKGDLKYGKIIIKNISLIEYIK